ncbi:MAG: hypothetical protein H7Y18_09295 [Clostridiaceae bacterium]|nr:hypothetical protein [Clostridiaceae bacterium]
MEIAVFQDNSGKTQSIFVAREIIGLPYTLLDGMGFNTWELEGTPKVCE